MVKFNNKWDDVLKGEFQKEYYQRLREFLKAEYSSRVIFPPMDEIFNAFKLTDFDDVKCVILGQDPYHGQGQAHGLAFSVRDGVRKPPSLNNIFKEMTMDMSEYTGKSVYIPHSGSLEKWAKEGVLLLNTSLTVREGAAGSHKKKGWEIFTDRVIELLNEREKPMVFILWGNPAKAKKSFITSDRHFVIEGVHPSPLSAYNGFFGGKYFSKTNEFLKSVGIEPIDWII